MDIDRYVGARMYERRIMLGMTQQQLAELIGVTYQQTHKYEKGTNRITAGRLFRVAQALDVEVGYFFQGVGEEQISQPTSQQRRMLDLAQNFISMPRRDQQEAVCMVAQAMAAGEPAEQQE